MKDSKRGLAGADAETEANRRYAGMTRVTRGKGWYDGVNVDVVEIEISPDEKSVWLNVDGVCCARVQNSKQVVVNAPSVDPVVKLARAVERVHQLREERSIGTHEAALNAKAETGLDDRLLRVLELICMRGSNDEELSMRWARETLSKTR